MTPNNSESPLPVQSRWPISEMLWRGTYGTQTEAERRYIVRSKIVGRGLLLWLLIAAAPGLRSQPTIRLITLLLPAPLLTYMAWEKHKYFLTLDELTRRIELEGMAWAYAIGVLASLWLGGIGYAVSLRWPLDSKFFSFGPFFLFGLLLVSVKGAYRYVATRRY
jgi:hypothetical protein